MENMTILELKKELAEKGFELTPYSSEEIDIAVNYFGGLPEVLVDYYKHIGKITLTNSSEEHITIASPSDLVKLNDQEFEFVQFAEEYAGMFELNLKKENIKECNPVVYVSGEVAYLAIEDEAVEEKALAENLLFDFEDEGIYLSGEVTELTEGMLDENSKPLEGNMLIDLLTTLNFFFRYDTAFITKDGK